MALLVSSLGSSVATFADGSGGRHRYQTPPEVGEEITPYAAPPLSGKLELGPGEECAGETEHALSSLLTSTPYLIKDGEGWRYTATNDQHDNAQ